MWPDVGANVWTTGVTLGEPKVSTDSGFRLSVFFSHRHSYIAFAPVAPLISGGKAVEQNGRTIALDGAFSAVVQLIGFVTEYC